MSTLKQELVPLNKFKLARAAVLVVELAAILGFEPFEIWNCFNYKYVESKSSNIVRKIINEHDYD